VSTLVLCGIIVIVLSGTIASMDTFYLIWDIASLTFT
jgi:hypothetical protein